MANRFPTRADDERALHVLRLRDAGKSSAEIARAAGLRDGSAVRAFLSRLDRDCAAEQ